MSQEKGGTPDDTPGLEAAEHLPSRSDSVRPGPKLRIKLPSDEGSPGDSNGPSRMSVDEEKGEAGTKPDAPVKRERLIFEGWRKLRKWLADTGLVPDFCWVTNNLEAAKFKPAIRSAVAAWVSLLLMIILPAEEFLGQAGYVIIVAAFLAPPVEPFMQVLEKEIFIIFLAAVSYAWTCLGIFLASLARNQFDHSAVQLDIFSGKYLEAGPAVICAAFLFLGTGLLLYTRARIGPGPIAPAFILACIVMDISLGIAHLFPYAYYQLGASVVKPVAIHSAISIVCSIIILPETVNAQFIKRFRGLFLPLAKALRTQPQIFAVSAMSDNFDPNPFYKEIENAEAALAPLAATSRILKRDLSWGRFGSKDFSRLHELARIVTVRVNGMAFYFKIMDSSVNKQRGMPGFSLLNTPVGSPGPSRPVSPTASMTDLQTPSPSNVSIASSRRRRRHRQMSSTHHSLNLYHHTLSHNHSHIHNPLSHIFNHHHRHSHTNSLATFSVSEAWNHDLAVGVFETQRYLNLESKLLHPRAEEFIPVIVSLLGECSKELTECCAETLEYLAECFANMNEYRFWKLFRRTRSRTWGESIRNDEAARARLQVAIDSFQKDKRFQVLNPYRDHVDSGHSSSDTDPPPHRYLFQCYMYQYHLLCLAQNLAKFLEELIDLEKTRPRSRIWLPILPLNQILFWSRWEPNDDALEHNEDEDPDLIQGIDPVKTRTELLGGTAGRDPDALPPRNIFEAIAHGLYQLTSALGHGNAVFGFKAGLLSVVLSLPTFFPNTALFSYSNRSSWALVIGQLTLSRFRGDTSFGWFSRVISTFLGGILGAILWYMSAGLGSGNAFGLAVVTAVAFPIMFFIRLYYPAAPITLTIFGTTVGLVIGYSWQDEHLALLTNQGKGISVAYKRFILVTIGVTAAYIFSWLPPTTTLRKYLRTTYATTVQQIGQAYCDVLSFATMHGGLQTEAIVKELIANRLKLRRSQALMSNVVYEFSMQGKWPKERYQTVCEIQLEIAYLLSHLRSVMDHFEVSWARAFMKRTRFLEPEFQGDVLAVISLISTSLRTGMPLPQVTPCPLLDRFFIHQHGLNVLRVEDQDIAEEYGLPRVLDIETLENEQYLYFCVGLTTAFGIITRLDRLMMATKELVGEQFHIHGLPVCMPRKT